MAGVLFIIGCALFSASLSYAWWTRLRVLLLREDLFHLRDELFDAAIAHDRLDDPAHRDLRNRFNGLIRFAHLWDFAVVGTIITSRTKGRARVESEDPRFDDVVASFSNRGADRVACYLMYETLTGSFVRVLVTLFVSQQKLESWTQTRFRSMIDVRPDCVDHGAAAH